VLLRRLGLFFNADLELGLFWISWEENANRFMNLSMNWPLF
jgi:hypothetical protein